MKQLEVAPEETSVTLACRIHFEDTGMLVGWNVLRINRLCRMAHCTEYELAARYGVSIKRMKRFLQYGVFPPELCLHFATFERYIMARFTKVA